MSTFFDKACAHIVKQVCGLSFCKSSWRIYPAPDISQIRGYLIDHLKPDTTVVAEFILNCFIQTELEEQINALKSSEDHAKKASADASRLAEELRQEQEHSAQVEKARRTAEAAAKDLQTRLDEAEAAAMQGGRKIVQKMEQVWSYTA